MRERSARMLVVYGHAPSITPTLDLLRREGVMFETAGYRTGAFVASAVLGASQCGTVQLIEPAP